MNIKNILVVCGIVSSLMLLSVGTSAFAGESKQTLLERGRYIVAIGGCNDCHTLGFAENGGQAPEESKLLGSPVGMSGPWGTTYPANLRHYYSQLTEDQWLQTAKTFRARPPMPWWGITEMTEHDLRAMHAYITSLGANDDAVPAYLPPDQKPSQPFIQWPLQAEH